MLLHEAVGAVSVHRLCPRCGDSSHGRPSVRVGSGSSPQVSIAYADGLVAVAWSYAGPVGVDVEGTGPAVDGVDRADFTRREAMLKAGRADLPAVPLPDLPDGFVGTVVGRDAAWRIRRDPDPGSAVS